MVTELLAFLEMWKVSVAKSINKGQVRAKVAAAISLDRCDDIADRSGELSRFDEVSVKRGRRQRKLPTKHTTTWVLFESCPSTDILSRQLMSATRRLNSLYRHAAREMKLGSSSNTCDIWRPVSAEEHGEVGDVYKEMMKILLPLQLCCLSYFCLFFC